MQARGSALLRHPSRPLIQPASSSASVAARALPPLAAAEIGNGTAVARLERDLVFDEMVDEPRRQRSRIGHRNIRL